MVAVALRNLPEVILATATRSKRMKDHRSRREIAHGTDTLFRVFSPQGVSRGKIKTTQNVTLPFFFERKDISLNFFLINSLSASKLRSL